eukprot:7568191-Ditylum_brightwellii.AAC.1
MNDPRSKREYKNNLISEYSKLDIPNRLEKIANNAKFLASNKQIEEFELIDKERMKARERSLRKCNKFHAGG